MSLEDTALLEKAMAAKNGDTFRRLWEGDTSEYPSHSEADLALCSHLAFWTCGDAARTDRLFRASGLYRDKWEDLHGAETYGKMTIHKALEGVTAFYSPSRNGHKPNRRHRGKRVNVEVSL